MFAVFFRSICQHDLLPPRPPPSPLRRLRGTRGISSTVLGHRRGFAAGENRGRKKHRTYNKRHSKEFVAVKNTSLKANRNIFNGISVRPRFITVSYFCFWSGHRVLRLIILINFFNPAPVPPDQGFNLPAGADELLSEPLNTDFSCEGRRYGYFADVNNNCQVSVN